MEYTGSLKCCSTIHNKSVSYLLGNSSDFFFLLQIVVICFLLKNLISHFTIEIIGIFKVC